MKQFIWELLKKYIGRPVKRAYTKRKNDSLTVLSKPYTPPKSTYKNIITTSGFGHSGSGVIIDLMSEFDNTTVLGGHDVNGGSPLSKDRSVPKLEVDFVRRYGGVMDLESAFDEHAVANNIKLLNFIQLSEYYFKRLDFNIYNNKYMELTKKFIDELTIKRIETDAPLAGNYAFMFRKGCGKEYKNLQSPFTNNSAGLKKYDYILKKMSKQEYRQLAQKYITSFLKTIESKENLVIDQFLSDAGYDVEYFEQYIGLFKMFVVTRDPRDVYVQGIVLKETWIPKDKDEFIEWFNYQHDRKYMKEQNKNVLILNFEDLVLKYDNTISKIYEFLNIDKTHHTMPKTQFRPEYSKKNIGLYKSFEDQDVIKYIEDNLKEYCYYNY